MAASTRDVSYQDRPSSTVFHTTFYAILKCLCSRPSGEYCRVLQWAGPAHTSKRRRIHTDREACQRACGAFNVAATLIIPHVTDGEHLASSRSGVAVSSFSGFLADLKHVHALTPFHGPFEVSAVDVLRLLARLISFKAHTGLIRAGNLPTGQALC